MTENGARIPWGTVFLGILLEDGWLLSRPIRPIPSSQTWLLGINPMVWGTPSVRNTNFYGSNRFKLSYTIILPCLTHPLMATAVNQQIYPNQNIKEHSNISKSIQIQSAFQHTFNISPKVIHYWHVYIYIYRDIIVYIYHIYLVIITIYHIFIYAYGVALPIIHLTMIFHKINHPAIGVPPL